MPGSISIVAQDVEPDGTHNMLVRSIPKRFDPDAFLPVSTRVAFDPTSNFQFAGLMIGGADPDVDRLQLGRSYCDVDVCALGGLYFDRIESGKISPEHLGFRPGDAVPYGAKLPNPYFEMSTKLEPVGRFQ